MVFDGDDGAVFDADGDMIAGPSDSEEDGELMLEISILFQNII